MKTYSFEPNKKSNKTPLMEDRLEYQVLKVLRNLCDENEISGLQTERNVSGTKIRLDIFIENGIKNLDWPPNTTVDVHRVLNPRTIMSSYNQYEAIKRTGEDIGLFVILYYSSSFAYPPISDTAPDNLKTMSLSSLILKEESLNSSKAEQESSTPQNSKDTDKSEEINSSDKHSGDEDNQPLADELIFKDWKDIQKNRLDKLKLSLEKDNATLFLGAGVSASANMPGWGKLLEQILTNHSKGSSPDYFPCDLDNVLHSCGESYLIAARYIDQIIDIDNKAKIIQQTLYNHIKPSPLIEAICDLTIQKDINRIVTFNYDELIEQKLLEKKKIPYPVDQSGVIPKGSIAIYHVHGRVNDPSRSTNGGKLDAPVLSESDYHKLYLTGHHWSNTTILYALQHSTCIFIGLSMTDPNLRRLLESAVYGECPHYVLLPRIRLYEGYYDTDDRNIFHYQTQENIMASLGLNIIWYELSESSNPHENLVKIIHDLAAQDNESGKIS